MLVRVPVHGMQGVLERSEQSGKSRKRFLTLTLKNIPSDRTVQGFQVLHTVTGR
jgi:hypothetical protein